MSKLLPIHEAAQNGDLAAIKKEVSLGLSVNILGGEYDAVSFYLLYLFQRIIRI